MSLRDVRSPDAPKMMMVGTGIGSVSGMGFGRRAGPGGVALRPVVLLGSPGEPTRTRADDRTAPPPNPADRPHRHPGRDGGRRRPRAGPRKPRDPVPGPGRGLRDSLDPTPPQ